MNDKKSSVRKWGIVLIFVIFAILATYPAFVGGYFKGTTDGQIHFIRFEAITAALKNIEIPQLINFMGYQNVGQAFNGMYPWISGLIFILPKLFISKPIYALFVGFVLLNFVTILNTYLLARHLTTKIYWRLLGVMVYEFNSYHMIVMYGRNAVGEMLAYSFLPLVFLGYIQIMEGRRDGIWALGIGMGMILNSHVVSALFTFLILGIIELGRLFLKKISLAELVNCVYAGIVAIVVSCYSIANLLLIMHKNQLITPWKRLEQISVYEMWRAMLNNSISDVITWNIGLVSFVIFVAMIVQIFKKEKEGSWKYWIIGAVTVYFLTLSWIPYPKQLGETFLGNIQFLGRLLSFVMIFIVIGMCLYLEVYGVELSQKFCVGIVGISLVIMSSAGVVTFHNTKGDYDVRYYLNNNNYLSDINEGKAGWYDYMIANPKDNNRWLINIEDPNNSFVNRLDIKSNYSSLTFKINAQKSERVQLPFLLYNGIKYNISVNGKKEHYFNDGQILTINVDKGINSVKISSEVPKFNYFTFTLSIVAIIFSMVMLILTSSKKSWKNYVRVS
ncbi:hypothetical protein [Ligilactobacillus murinus]|uniref:Uncharacterized protein n=2 Tax=Ligilactobacillus murinus TaxID=1622 RepID=A0AAE6WGG9_9LACO|nr:hypothetical protein [Ligilactobacillus murinus]NEF88223.1 hypothetical protein [Ligilactobacillus murinus]NEF90507.1 hypothetical protein [Ligilactobacillus murinus]NEF92766.1 hypothetical protein [Ligilactobacillus murinus]NEF99520.1 hypothetical protein [Ligilactobacillus murinus]NEG01795.1 hypothetical protein [Ligilactobacillus murinus]